MNEAKVVTILHGYELPEMVCSDFFHSSQFFRTLEQASGIVPYMIVAFDAKKCVVAHMLIIIVTHHSFFPPFFIRHGHVYGEGEYEFHLSNKEEIFNAMLTEATRIFRRTKCLYAEFSRLKEKMFGYRLFRKNGYIPIPWQEVHNSLHSAPITKRLGHKTLQRITNIHENGVSTRPCNDDDETQRYVSLLKKHFRFKFRRNIPNVKLFQQIQLSGSGINLITTYKNKIIGGCTLLFSGNDAYLWFTASRRKTYPLLRPALMTVWGALAYAQNKGYDHLFFLDVGLPYRSNPYREFILNFGGKPTAKFRWFRFPFTGINKLLSWIYNG